MKDSQMVESVGNSVAAAAAVATVAYNEGIHGHPLIENLMWYDDPSAVKLFENMEYALVARGFTRVFTITHPDNLTEQALLEGLGYTKMILYDKTLVK